MNENDQVMLYREEAMALRRDLQFVRSRFEAHFGASKRRDLAAEDGIVLGILDQWIDRLWMVLKWRRLKS